MDRGIETAASDLKAWRERRLSRYCAGRRIGLQALQASEVGAGTGRENKHEFFHVFCGNGPGRLVTFSAGMPSHYIMG